jgi:hypothetical protein
MRGFMFILFLAFGILSVSPSSFACAVCFGTPGGEMSEVASKAILFMLGVVAFILSGVGLFAFHLWRRAKVLELTTQTASSL